MTAVGHWFRRLTGAVTSTPGASTPGGMGGDGARTAEGVRVYAVGDIHGRADLLDRLNARIREDITAHADRTPLVVYLGDYVDRGQDSRAVLETLSGDPVPGVETRFLRGNHEDVMLAFMNDPVAAHAWLEFGGRQTLSAYGVPVPGATSEAILEDMATGMRAALPDRHAAFLRSLPLHTECGDYLFVHAGVRPGVPMSQQKPADLMYIREPFLSHRKPLSHMIVHGHHVTEHPVVRANRIGIDTGAFATGCLTCLVLDGTERAFITT
ncbi:serine/threonine protein phosphatase [Roseospira marina]|uniref:Serine/threonine protein phosphatase n=1 Tax=Roseospira marina TaxID=140057 RepID=A0A5M6IGS3_9PROT|nr:metallophosphoesterase family protein [Roseospira marina]KAA5606875.1 serine/threonine protein phosphatase [Roseospira marina]MBB4312957.1 serine/threonine protein phosphatase 1 [Roseospira marina]MBB5086270.1 serine/threonine protein phosphatase 1 [Roseospira marina]